MFKASRDALIGTPSALNGYSVGRSHDAGVRHYSAVNLSKLSPRSGDQSPSRETARFTLTRESTCREPRWHGYISEGEVCSARLAEYLLLPGAAKPAICPYGQMTPCSKVQQSSPN